METKSSNTAARVRDLLARIPRDGLGLAYDPDGPPEQIVLGLARELVELDSGIAGPFGGLSEKGRAILEGLADALELVERAEQEARAGEVDYDELGVL